MVGGRMLRIMYYRLQDNTCYDGTPFASTDRKTVSKFTTILMGKVTITLNNVALSKLKSFD